MSIQFYLGASGSGKSYQLHKDILNEASKNKDINYLFIVPDQFTMQTQFDLVNASDNKGIMNVDVLSFSRLAHRIFEELGCNDQVVLDDTGKSLIIRRLSESLSKDMPVIGGNLNKIGYEHEIKSIISEFKQYNISLDRLDKIIDVTQKRGLLNSKLKDIKIIYEAFEEYIKDEFITSEETIILLSNKIYESEIIKKSIIIFDGFTGFTPVQYALIEDLMKLTKKVIVSVTVDINDDPYKISGEHELFYLSKKTILDIQKIAQRNNIIEENPMMLDDIKRSKNDELLHLVKHIFRYPVYPYDKSCENISIFECDNINDEVKNTCILIKNLVLDEGYEYRDIAVVCGDLSAYKDKFNMNSKLYDIPLYIDETKSIILNPFTEYIKSALNIIRDNFSYTSVFHFLRTGLIDISIEDIDRLDNYVIKCGIKGKKAWNQDFTRPPFKNSDGSVSSEGISELMRLNQSREKIISYLSPLMLKKSTVSKFIEAIYEFIINGNIKDRLDKYVEYFTLMGNKEKAKEYSQIYKLIMDLLNQMYMLLKDEPLKIDEFIELFESGIEEIDIGILPGGKDRLLIGDIERTRIPNVKILFFLGVNDGNIPKVNTKGGLISDIDREYMKGLLDELGIELSPTPREQLFSQRLYLYLNMTKPSDKLYLSYVKSIDGKSKNKSYLIGLMTKMYKGLTIINGSKLANSIEGVLNAEDGYNLASDMLRRYIDRQLSNDEIEKLHVLFKMLLENEDTSLKSQRLIESGYYEYTPQSLTKNLAKAIYGDELYSSVSRLEKYASCQYAHFLQYGMKLYNRDEFNFENNDIGNVYHGILESFSKSMLQKGYSLTDFPEEEAKSVLNEIITDLSVNYKEAILRSCASNEYKTNRMLNIMLRTVLTIKNQLKAGEFIPYAFESSFIDKINLDDDKKMLLKGKVDRIDICEDKEQNELYVKITDYKSGNKDIDYNLLFNGVQIQQPVYMIKVLKDLAKKYGIKDGNITPKMAAMLYYHLSNPIIDTNKEMTKQEADISIDEALRPTGLVSDNEKIINKLDNNLTTGGIKSKVIPVDTKKDGSYTAGSKIISDDDFNVINRYLDMKISDTGNEILNGSIKINPLEGENIDSCKYCDYKEICEFDTKVNGFKKRKLIKKSKDEIIYDMKELTGFNLVSNNDLES